VLPFGGSDNLIAGRSFRVPLYEYECSKCHHRFEKIEKVSASEVQKCPKCGGKAERQISRSAIQFKGSGWYVTDYAGKKSGDTGQDSSGKSGSGDSGGNSAAGGSGSNKTSEGGGDKGGSGTDKQSNEKSSGEKSGSEKSSSENTSSQKSGGEKSGREKSGGGRKGKRD
jgi:putative FmdB family regulatory protein